MYRLIFVLATIACVLLACSDDSTSTPAATATATPTATATTAPETPTATATTAPETPSATATTAPETPTATATTAPETPTATVTTAPETPTATASTGEWAFTDDTGQEIVLPSTPVRIIAQEDSAAALWSFGIRPIATFGNTPLSENPQFAAEEIAGLESVGDAFGEIDIEKIAALDPDIIVTTQWPSQSVGGGGFQDEAQQRIIAEIAPIIEINSEQPFRAMIGRYEELASALGADLEAPEVREAIDGLDAAFERLAAVAAAQPDLVVMAASGYSDADLYVANPAKFSDLWEFRASGLTFVEPEHTDDFGGLWEALSWERANTYDADVILLDARPPDTQAEDLATVATWNTLPAVRAQQLGPWYVGTAYRIDFFTANVEELVDLIEAAEVVRNAP